MTNGPIAPTAKPTLAAVAIAKNEQRDIVGFLNHLAPWVDEIVIVDDGSTDGTLDFIKTFPFPVKLIHRRLEPHGGFAAQRNAGIDAASADWLLHMDIDERVTPELAAEIRSAIASTANNAFRYRRLNFFLHRPFLAGGWETWNAPQLGRRGAHRFVSAIHERVEVDGGDASTGQLSSRMWHLNDESYTERLEKNARYSVLSADAILAKSPNIHWWDMLGKPLYNALKAYFLRGAWRHGMHGLIFGVYTFSSNFNWYATAWDKRHRIPREDLESQLQAQWASSAATPRKS